MLLLRQLIFGLRFISSSNRFSFRNISRFSGILEILKPPFFLIFLSCYFSPFSLVLRRLLCLSIWSLVLWAVFAWLVFFLYLLEEFGIPRSLQKAKIPLELYFSLLFIS